MKYFFRNYALASLVIVVLAALAIFLAYRSIVIRSLTVLAEATSIATARLALHPIRHHLIGYLEAVNRSDVDPKSVALPRELEGAIAEVMRDSRVVRVKIYNRDGIVTFSTRASQIGDRAARNPGFVGAMEGRAAVKLIYRDHFNAFDESTEADNLVQSYLPVRDRPTSPVLGVFETYTDVNVLVMESEHSEILITVAMMVVLGTMYAALLVFVAHSNRLMQEQQRTIREKSDLLEQLSNKSMAREESLRKRWAADLHEGLAQTLGAVKLALEGALAADKNAAARSLVPILQDAIGQARALAMTISPPGLDEFGLGATLRGLRGEFERAHPAIEIELQLMAVERAVPPPLKIVIYRVIEAVFKLLDEPPAAPRLQHLVITLERDASAVTLLFEDDAGALAAALDDPGEVLRERASEVRERVIISGGRLTVQPCAHATAALCAVWEVAAERE